MRVVLFADAPCEDYLWRDPLVNRPKDEGWAEAIFLSNLDDKKGNNFR